MTGYKKCDCGANMLAHEKGISIGFLIAAIILTLFSPTLLAIPFAILCWFGAFTGRHSIYFRCPACGKTTHPYTPPKQLNKATKTPSKPLTKKEKIRLWIIFCILGIALFTPLWLPQLINLFTLIF